MYGIATPLVRSLEMLLIERALGGNLRIPEDLMELLR
jgi:hypothetical protein